jgi:hypothetical protein
MLELACGEGADRLFVWCKTRYSVVPDFFGHDMAFTSAVCDLPRFGLPTQNFLLNLIAGGDCIVMCVWPAAEQRTHAVLTGEGPDRVIRGCEIQGGAQRTLSVAFFERAGIWHEPKSGEEDTPDAVTSDWSPPFDARWRADRLTSAPWTESSDFSEGQLAETSFVYPLDRSPKTPLTAFCPVDVLRNTLGVGPCQYVLQTEGLASDANPTPAHVMTWVEEQFEQDKEKENADEIQARLAAMTDHVAHAQARIERYAALAAEVQALLRANKDNGQPSHAASWLGETVARLRATSEPDPEQEGPPKRAARSAAVVVGLIDGGDVEECRRLGHDLRTLGAQQDSALSGCRMAVRWLDEQARMTRLKDPKSADLAGKIAARVARFLQEK